MSAAAPSLDFGGRLRQAREARGVSLRQIASSTKISMLVLEALERNDFSKLPGGIFSRAFIRSYAQEVGVDPEQLVEEFLASLPSGSEMAVLHAPAPDVERDERTVEGQRRAADVAVKLVLVSAPIAGLLLYVTLGRGARAPVATPVAPAAADHTRSVEPPPSDLAPVQPPPAEVPIPAAAGDPTRVVPPGQNSPEAAGDLVLEMIATGSCWVSLTVDGRVVVARVMDAGERIVQRVRDGAALHVGDAGAFGFVINGRPGRALGAPGEVKSVFITRDNYESFVR
jgi:cytoskeletal protein RodZ